MNIGVHVFFFVLEFLFSSGIHPGMELLGHMVVLFSVSWGSSMLFSTVVSPIYIPSYSVQGSLFFTSLQHLLFVVFFDYSHSDNCEVIPLCGFDLHFSDDQWYWATFHVPVGPLYVFSGKMSIQILCPFFNRVVWFFGTELYITYHLYVESKK